MGSEGKRIKNRSDVIDNALQEIQSDISKGINSSVNVDLVAMGNVELIVRVEPSEIESLLNLNNEEKYNSVSVDTLKLQIEPKKSLIDLGNNPVND